METIIEKRNAINKLKELELRKKKNWKEEVDGFISQRALDEALLNQEQELQSQLRLKTIEEYNLKFNSLEKLERERLELEFQKKMLIFEKRSEYLEWSKQRISLQSERTGGSSRLLERHPTI